MLGIKKIRLFDGDVNASHKCYVILVKHGFEVTICHSPEAAIVGAVTITTCTADKRNATILSDKMITGAVHINAIGGDCPGKTEIDKKLLLRGEVFVEYAEQTRVEGDIQPLPADFPVVQMHKVINGQLPGRTSSDQVTIFDGVGFAIEDFSALRYVHQLMAQYRTVNELELIATPDDPRNLFGLIDSQPVTSLKTISLRKNVILRLRRQWL